MAVLTELLNTPPAFRLMSRRTDDKVLAPPANLWLTPAPPSLPQGNKQGSGKMSNRPSNAIYGADVLDKIAVLWAKGVKTTEIAHKLKIPHGSACRLARLARLRGDERFPARVFAPQRGPRTPKEPKLKAEKPRSKPARLKSRPVSAPKPKFNPVLLLYPRIYELKRRLPVPHWRARRRATVLREAQATGFVLLRRAYDALHVQHALCRALDRLRREARVTEARIISLHAPNLICADCKAPVFDALRQVRERCLTCQWIADFPDPTEREKLRDFFEKRR